MQKLPMLEDRRGTLEKCVFCPKLCRTACPVSNAIPRETLTPWGKMSMSYFVAQGDVPATAPYAAPAWACSGCLACRDSCDHKNDVAGTLLAARAGLQEIGVAPPTAVATTRRWERHALATRQAVRELMHHPSTALKSPIGLLIGCAYARAAPEQARDAIVAASGLASMPVSLVEACCGLPLLEAGDRAGFERQALTLATETGDKRTLVVADAGCAYALRTHYRGVATLSPRVELLVERAARDLTRLKRAPGNGAGAAAGPVRYHDPCRLGRGLGVYEEPRAVLTRVLGAAPLEFTHRRDRARCSGAGGLLPVTMPDAARAIAAARIDDHVSEGGGALVTACASSFLAFRRILGGAVSDMSSWIARSVPPWQR